MEPITKINMKPVSGVLISDSIDERQNLNRALWLNSHNLCNDTRGNKSHEHVFEN